ncbi:MAG: hypothetical protein H8D67_04405 [Deltaproteobacteria bacterium]|nr:hypothetical protein [Deltaproteobacteria bacterium]
MLITDLLQQAQATDQEILDSAYGIENFTFDTIPSPAESKRLRQMRNRLDELKAMKRVALRARVAGKQTRMVLADCGHYTIEVMSTSRGSSCPNCYDRMSNLTEGR